MLKQQQLEAQMNENTMVKMVREQAVLPIGGVSLRNAMRQSSCCAGVREADRRG